MGKTFLPEGTKGVKPVFSKNKRISSNIKVDVPKSSHVNRDTLTTGYKVTGVMILGIFAVIGFTVFVQGAVKLC